MHFNMECTDNLECVKIYREEFLNFFQEVWSADMEPALTISKLSLQLGYLIGLF